MELIVRNAIKEDVDKILEILNHEILNSTSLYDYEERTYENQLQWFEKKIIDGLPVIVVEKGNNVVGFGSYGIFRPWAAYQYSVEHSIYIEKSFRAMGVGKVLLTELIKLAKNNGFHTMIAGIDASNKGSIEFHKKFGFTEVGFFKEVGYKFDKWLDLIFLQLML